ncbi:MAG: hypothetical protein SOZ59_10885 [Candidatus Limivivens sp.]|nr:hypothetical protein [Candidatus Limivivens sp.]
MKKWKMIYAVLFFGICLIPSVGLLFGGSEESTENRDLSELPKLQTEEGWNSGYLEQLGDYFQEHFAYRNELVTANALLNGRVFGVSTASGVIQGTDGWLYYMDSLEDYQRTNPMSERSLFNVAHSLALMQDYVEKKDCAFVFTVAPNKNTLYGEHMPYYYQIKTENPGNLERLEGYLEEEQVSYADLWETLSGWEEVLYHRRDSHWNNKGASIAADCILDTLGKLYISYTDGDYEVRKDFIGDLDEMLYPKALTPEEEIYYAKPFTYSYVEEVESNFAPRISTVSSLGSGSLVMYRDSFGNALLPYMAQAYGNAYFSRGIPYQLTDLDTHLADTVVVERAERFLPDMAGDPPVMPGPLVIVSGEDQPLDPEMLESLEVSSQGLYTKISGTIPKEALNVRSKIYVKVDGNMAYEAFPVTWDNGEEGFVLYLESGKFSGLENQIEVYIKEDIKG